MKILANAFLILFVNAAALGIADTLLSRLWGIIALHALSGFATGLTILLGLLLFPGFAFNKHLPKLVLVPPLLYLLWGMLDFWPLEYVAGEGYRFYAAVAQLLLGVSVLQFNLILNKKSRLLVPEQFSGPAFDGRNLLTFALVSVPLLPLVVLLLCFATASSVIEESTANFIRLKPNGLYMVEKSYRKQDKIINLTSMIHLGQQEYYDSLSSALQGQQAILLAEGATDKTGRLQGEFSYQKIADLLGLASQEQMLLDGRLVSTESLDQLEDLQPGRTDILPADIDLSEFDEQTIAMLNALGTYVLNSDSLTEGFDEFNQWAIENTSPETNQIVMQDLVQKRNSSVLSYLPKALQKYDTVVIPWGALHMPGLETAVKHKGFELQSQQEYLSIDFLILPYGQLFGSP